MFPIVHLAKAVPASFGSKSAAAWTWQPMGLDGAYHKDKNGNISKYIKLFDVLGRAGIAVIPSFSCSTPASYNTSVKPLIGHYAAGIIIKTELSTIAGMPILARSLGVLPTDVDVVVDLRRIRSLYR